MSKRPAVFKPTGLRSFYERQGFDPARQLAYKYKIQQVLYQFKVVDPPAAQLATPAKRGTSGVGMIRPGGDGRAPEVGDGGNMGVIAKLNVDHLIGKEVGTSTILKELARGGMAIVFIAYQRTLKRQIALKILPKSMLTPKTAERFQSEAESAAILSHPNIIPVYEVGETDDFLFFTMQLVQGKSLGRYIQMAMKNLLPSRRSIPVDEAARITVKVLDALAYAHGEEIIHRDIKPDNILIERHTQRPLITDFGVAKVLRGEDDKTPMIQGTPVYMPPEQILGRDVDARSDIYAVGTMLFKMLSPDLPFPPYSSKTDLLKQKIRRKDGIFLKRPSEVNPHVDEEIDRVILKATAYRQEDRYADCRSFMQDLEHYRQSL
jgi:serine/threonine protein kinase